MSPRAGVPDPQIQTDHPVYRGELSCSTLERTVGEAYRVFEERYGHWPASETEKLVALWIWQCEHHMHNLDPLVFGGLDHPDALQDGWMETRDRSLGQFSFGFSLCYTIHAQFSALVGYALGDLKRTSCPDVPGHTSFEAYVDGKWAMADMTTGMMSFDDAGRPMSILEIIPHVIGGGEGERIWTSDPRRTGFGAFRVTPFGDNWDVYKAKFSDQKLFGYDAFPIVYVLRPGETFTRFLEPGLDDGKTWAFWGSDYYRHDKKGQHGPYRNVTFLDDPPVGLNREGRGHARYSNGVFEYAPSLEDGSYRQGLWNGAGRTGVEFREGALRPTGNVAELIFEHYSPYVIAARSARGGARVWNVRQEECLDGAVISGKAEGELRVAISIDAGQTWAHAGLARGDFKIDFTDIVKGRHFYLLRVSLPEQSGLVDFRMRTVTQVARAVFPRLKDGGTTVSYRSSGRAALHGGPSQALAERFRHTAAETTGYRVYRIPTPGPVRSAAGAARCEGEGELPWGPWSVEFSLDAGQTWIGGVSGLTLTPAESQWGGGRFAYAWAQKEFTGDSREVWVRFGRGKIRAAEVYVTYETANDSDLEVSFGWVEGSRIRNHYHRIGRGKSQDTWEVPTGENIGTKWVRFQVR
jgi:hypothetical protein